MKKIIHINQHKIRANLRKGTFEPVITVKDYRSNEYAHEVELIYQGEVIAKVIYSPNKPLSCGARVWIESDSKTLDLNLILKDQDQ